MSEEIDYAEMLEIPVSTVNVVKKKSRKRREDIRERVIDDVNERLNDESEEDGRIAESTVIEGEPIKNGNFFSFGSDKKSSIILIAEFAAACLLCTAIFLTNIFMTDSAINTFLGGLFESNEVKADNRSYSEFTLNSIVGDKADIIVNVSAGGVMSFTGECFVYPVCSGKVSSVTKERDGEKYTVSITHSDSFESIVTGLDVCYYAVGENVKGNIPLGYSDGETEINVMLYDNDSLLNCYSVADGNSLAWKA